MCNRLLGIGYHTSQSSKLIWKCNDQFAQLHLLVLLLMLLFKKILQIPATKLGNYKIAPVKS